MKIKKYKLGMFLSSFLFVGCAQQQQQLSNPIVVITEEEAFKYENEYSVEYDKIQEQNKNLETPFKWIQPKNKKEQCKVYVSSQS